MSVVDLSAIPGMIEPVEQTLLFEYARSMHLADHESMVEFGTFFGRSTSCIAAGLRANRHRHDSNLLYAYDSFRCDVRGPLSPHVLAFAKSGSVDSLLDINDRTISFKRVFEHYLDADIARGLLRVVASELVDSEPPPGGIALMHVDGPKYYREFKPVLFRFFPHLRVGSIVVFQDYYYHWSATLIAAVQVLLELGIIRFTTTAASSLAVVVIEAPTAEKMMALDLIMQGSDPAALIDRAMVACSNLEFGIKDKFFPRLHLAKMQVLWDRQDYQRATLELRTYLDNGGKVCGPLVNDLMELMAFGFSMRQVYELDHRPT